MAALAGVPSLLPDRRQRRPFYCEIKPLTGSPESRMHAARRTISLGNPLAGNQAMLFWSTGHPVSNLGKKGRAIAYRVLA